jgi:3-isopropylmalate dehydrogenase
MKYQIAVIPGDGIGPEVTTEALKALHAVGRLFGHEFTCTTVLMGGCAIDACGEPLPEATLKVCRQSDSVLLGAVGGPKWDTLPGSQRPEAALLRIRAELGVYANLRPAIVFPQLIDASPLRPEIIGNNLDVLIVRELTGGIYFGKRGRTADGTGAFDTEYYTVPEIERILKIGFVAARGRKRHLTVVDKANVLESSRLWREVAIRMAKEYPDVKTDYMYVDNCAMQLVRNPTQFDVLVTSNMFGDILSDEASMITGSIGMLASASLGDGKCGLYEPIHGSAPDIAGTGKANPLATILSVAMMLRHSFQLEREAVAIENAVRVVLDRGARTADIAGRAAATVGTREMGQLVTDAIVR